MEGNQSGSGSSASPAPFLLKTYEMVDDSKTDEIVSWSSKNNSFIVWNPPEFSRLLLPTYFKHNNFSSFIRQLNTYGFRKIDPEKWEFHNEDFLKDQKHLLKNIYRRKPVHSHSQPTISEDQERTTLEEKIESLEQEKITLLADLSRFKQHLPGAKLYLDELERRVKDMESRQLRMIQYVEDAVNNPSFVEHLVQMAEPFSDISSINRKRRLPNGTYPLDLVENSFIENSSSTNVQPEVVHIFHPDFSNKLRLQLSPAISEGNLCLYENGDTVPKNPTDGDQRNLLMMKRSISLVPEDAEHSEHSAPPLTSKKNQSLSKTIGSNGRPEFHNLRFHEEDDAYMSCQLNLTLSSSPLQVNGTHCPSKILHCSNKDENCSYDKEIHDDSFVKSKSQIDCDTTKSLAQETSVVNEVHGVSQVAVNDVFWERFLTERPGCSDTEEASSSLREGPQDEQEGWGTRFEILV